MDFQKGFKIIHFISPVDPKPIYPLVMPDYLFVTPYLISIRFVTKLYKLSVGSPMGTYCSPLAADLFSHCYDSDFVDTLTHENQADFI